LPPPTPVEALPFSHKQIHPADQRFRLRWAGPDRFFGDVIEAVAGERIVAFARPGKPPEIPFLRQIGAHSRHPGTARSPAARNGF
jgi:hypothetical protein